MYKKKCWVCNRVFKDGNRVIPVETYIVNEKRGDFTGQASEFIHAAHLKVLYND